MLATTLDKQLSEPKDVFAFYCGAWFKVGERVGAKVFLLGKNNLNPGFVNVTSISKWA